MINKYQARYLPTKHATDFFVQDWCDLIFKKDSYDSGLLSKDIGYISVALHIVLRDVEKVIDYMSGNIHSHRIYPVLLSNELKHSNGAYYGRIGDEIEFLSSVPNKSSVFKNRRTGEIFDTGVDLEYHLQISMGIPKGIVSPDACWVKLNDEFTDEDLKPCNNEIDCVDINSILGDNWVIKIKGSQCKCFH